MSWSLIPIDFGPLLMVRVHNGHELAGELLLSRTAYVDLRHRLSDEPDLHDLHPQPGDPAPPLPAGVDGFAPTRQPTSTTG